MIPGLAPHPDADSTPFWAALRQHRLEVQRCASCGLLRFPPRPICARCHSWEAAWIPVAGRGRLVSFVRTHQRFVPGLETPYVVIEVVLDEQDDLAMYGALAGSVDGIAVGDRVVVQFEDVDADVTLANWRRT